MRLKVDFLRAALLGIFLVLTALLAQPLQALAAGRVGEFIGKLAPSAFFTDADRFGSPQGDPPLIPAYKGNQLLGYVYLNADITSATGYSGKPIHLLVGIDPKGVVTAVKLVDHKEPIVLIGIPEAKIVAAMNKLIGVDMNTVAKGAQRPPDVDIVSGATVTVLVMADSVTRSAVRLIRSGRLSGAPTGAPAAAIVEREVDEGRRESRTWEELLGDGSVRRLALTVGEVSEAFTQAGKTEAAVNAETSDPADSFIDLYLAPVRAGTHKVLGFIGPM